MNVLYFHKCRCYRGMVANVFAQFVEATERRGERGFKGSKTVLKLEYRGTCLGCSQVGHHNASLYSFRKNQVVWSFLFFPQLVKTADLDPRQNYVVGFHPHGVLVAGAFTNFCTYATGFRQLFPGLTSYLLMLPLWFRAPFFRDYIMFAGVGQRRLNPTPSDWTVSLIELV